MDMKCLSNLFRCSGYAVKDQIKDMWFKPGDENKIYHTPNVPSAAYDIL